MSNHITMNFRDRKGFTKIIHIEADRPPEAYYFAEMPKVELKALPSRLPIKSECKKVEFYLKDYNQVNDVHFQAFYVESYR